MSNTSNNYWRQWRQGVMVWLIGVAGAFTYLQLFPERTGVNDFLMASSALVGICAFIDPLLHPWLLRRGLRRA